MDSSEKRRAQRFPMALPVAIKLDKNGVEKTVQTKDVSSNGVYFEFSAPIEVGSSLEFILTLPGEITQGNSVRVRCRGKVVRVDRASEAGDTLGLAATIERYEFVRDSD